MNSLNFGILGFSSHIRANFRRVGSSFVLLFLSFATSLLHGRPLVTPPVHMNIFATCVTALELAAWDMGVPTAVLGVVEQMKSGVKVQPNIRLAEVRKRK